MQEEEFSLGFGKHLGIVYVNLEHRELRGRGYVAYFLSSWGGGGGGAGPSN